MVSLRGLTRSRHVNKELLPSPAVSTVAIRPNEWARLNRAKITTDGPPHGASGGHGTLTCPRSTTDEPRCTEDAVADNVLPSLEAAEAAVTPMRAVAITTTSCFTSLTRTRPS